MQFESIDEKLAGALDCLREVPPPDAEGLAAQRLAFVGRVVRTRKAAGRAGPAGRVRWLGWLPYQICDTRRIPMVRVLVALAVMFVGGSSGVIYAADGAVPGDLLYGLDRAVESLQLGLTTSSEAVTNLMGSFASERLREANQLAAAGDEENMAAALADYDNIMLGLNAAATAATLGQEKESGAPGAAETSTTEPSATPVPTDTATAEPSVTPVPTETATTEPSATPVPTGTATAEPSATPVPTGTATAEPPGTCVGVDPHPVAAKLAEEYGVSLEEIMEWFCEGNFGFGEIKLALAAGEKAGMAPEELLNMKDELGGWGLVWQELGLKGKDKNKDSGDDTEPPDQEDASQDAPDTPAKDKDKDKDHGNGPDKGKGKP